MADGIRLEWSGLQELGTYFDGLGDSFEQEVVTEMEIYSSLVETGGRALAHRYGGDLEQSIVAARVAIENGLVIGEVGSNLVYAWYIHEKPYKLGKGNLYDNGYFEKDYYIDGRGRRTREKSSWRGQMPGRKYLERAVAATETDFYAGMERARDKALGAGP